MTKAANNVKRATKAAKRAISKLAGDKQAKRASSKQAATFTLAQLARDNDINPKIARAKFRRHEDEMRKLTLAGSEGHSWVFPAKLRAKVLELLMSGRSVDA